MIAPPDTIDAGLLGSRTSEATMKVVSAFIAVGLAAGVATGCSSDIAPESAGVATGCSSDIAPECQNLREIGASGWRKSTEDIAPECQNLRKIGASGWRKSTDTGGDPTAVYGPAVGQLIIRGNYTIHKAWPAKIDGYCYADVTVNGVVDGNSYSAEAHLLMQTGD